MAEFEIYRLELGAGWIGICPAPGRHGPYAVALKAILALNPALVLTLCEALEMTRFGAESFGNDLKSHGCAWQHFPVVDYQAPDDAQDWASLSAQASKVVTNGGGVLAHCAAGCGRSGMALLRLMCEFGEPADRALARLRAVRACAVETLAQLQWAMASR